MSLKGKVAIITGGSTGIGKATAANGTYFAPFTGLFAYSLSVRLDPNTAAEIQFLSKVAGTTKQVDQALPVCSCEDIWCV